MHLAQLDKRASKLPWSDWLSPGIPVRIEATCRKSKIYHHKAAAQRIEGAVTAAGIALSPDAEIVLKVRIEDDLCTVSVDTSGESLHKRGMKEQVNKAPMRETLAALFLRACGYRGDEPVLDPMCGSGTFVIEAAEIARGSLPGRARGFAFERLASFDSGRWDALRDASPPHETALLFCGSDRDQGAIGMSQANAKRAGVDGITRFTCAPISEAAPPEGPPGLVIVNPPYGGRIGNKTPLYGLYAAFGERMKTAFPGWRVGLITSEPGLAKATGLRWTDTGPIVDHGGTKIRLYQTKV
jgi:putative N6-adenine-specific DNA methylase